MLAGVCDRPSEAPTPWSALGLKFEAVRPLRPRGPREVDDAVALWRNHVHDRIAKDPNVNWQVDMILRSIAMSVHRHLDPVAGNDPSFVSDDLDRCIRWYGSTDFTASGAAAMHQGEEHPVLGLWTSQHRTSKQKIFVSKLLVAKKARLIARSCAAQRQTA